MTEGNTRRRAHAHRAAVPAGLAVAAATVTGLTLWFLLTPETIDALNEAWRRAEPVPMALALALMPVVQLLRAWRFQILLHSGGRPPLPLVGATTALLAINTLVPFRLGEASFPLFMKRLYGTSIADASGVLLLARLMDLSSIAALLVVVLLAGGMTDGLGLPVWMWGGVLIGLGMVSALPLVSGRDDPARVPLTPPRHPTMLRRLWIDLTRVRGRLSGGSSALLVVVLSYAVWVCHAAAAILAAQAVTDGARASAAAAAGLASNIAFALPAAGVAGLGAPQAAWVAVQRIDGVPFAEAVVTAFAYYAVTLMATVVLGAIGVGYLLASLRAKAPHNSTE